jgi:hypothetical protein
LEFRAQLNLDHEIVSVLVEAVLRLLPIENSSDGVRERQERDNRDADLAHQAEEGFATALAGRGHRFLTAREQTDMRLTPDVRFLVPTAICGHTCV